jgi:hypothetical protein
MLRTVGYTGERLLVGVEAVYSRSWTACEEDLVGTDLSSVAEGTLVDVVEDGMVEWSSVQKP